MERLRADPRVHDRPDRPDGRDIYHDAHGRGSCISGRDIGARADTIDVDEEGVAEGGVEVCGWVGL